MKEGVGSISQYGSGDPDPDPHQMSRIPNTGKQNFSVGEFNRRCKLKCVSLIPQNMVFTQNLAHIKLWKYRRYELVFLRLLKGIWAVVGKCDESIALP